MINDLEIRKKFREWYKSSYPEYRDYLPNRNVLLQALEIEFLQEKGYILNIEYLIDLKTWVSYFVDLNKNEEIWSIDHNTDNKIKAIDEAVNNLIENELSKN